MGRYGSGSWKPSLSICAHFQHPVLEMGQVLVLYIAFDDVKETVCGIQSDYPDSQQYLIKLCLIWAENFRMVDIEINA